jgi:hypothetical protein
MRTCRALQAASDAHELGCFPAQTIMAGKTFPPSRPSRPRPRLLPRPRQRQRLPPPAPPSTRSLQPKRSSSGTGPRSIRRDNVATAARRNVPVSSAAAGGRSRRLLGSPPISLTRKRRRRRRRVSRRRGSGKPRKRGSVLVARRLDLLHHLHDLRSPKPRSA